MQMNQSNLSKYMSTNASIISGLGRVMALSVHAGSHGDFGLEESPGIVDRSMGACVPNDLYMFMAREIEDLLAPNCCCVSGDSIDDLSRSGFASATGGLNLSGLGDKLLFAPTFLADDGLSLLGALSLRRRFLVVEPGLDCGRHSTPERTHIIHGFVLSHWML